MNEYIYHWVSRELVHKYNILNIVIIEIPEANILGTQNVQIPTWCTYFFMCSGNYPDRDIYTSCLCVKIPALTSARHSPCSVTLPPKEGAASGVLFVLFIQDLFYYFFFQFFLYFYVCGCFACMFVCVSCSCSAHGSSKKVSDPSGWSYRQFVSPFMWVPAAKLRASLGKSLNVVNYQASPQPLARDQEGLELTSNQGLVMILC